MKFNLLIIDDEEDIRTVLKEYINEEFENINVELSKNADEAFYLFENTNFHIVFLDIVMPGMDSFEFLKKIKSQNSFTQIIIITGNSDLNKIINAFENGADDYLTKPFDINTINEIIINTQKKLKRWSDLFKDAL
ncbi:hypothetical protein OSSY52_13700 [Tepiditoga spiralis]|uniref:Response regulatory domain-containing protein n=1 Tax=Tepiditoga spiralis TaxID=2108365 RepID=A0A7G1GBP2_9BACT|nr:response regulator [Tepiditoga spiralis]BBE31229.1 hypothetical protein OSSY52_13700 [Tepiditoga spiralis]